MRKRSRRFVGRVVLFVAALLLTPLTIYAVEVVSGPTLRMNPGGVTPLVGVVELETDVAVHAVLTITDGIDLWTVSFPQATQQHYLPVLGLKPDRTYTVDVDLVPGGRAGTVFATTASLPSNFPEVVVNVSDPAAMEPGYTWMDCLRGDAPSSNYTAIVDNAGDVVWYTRLCIQGQPLPNGNIFYRAGDQAIEVDLLLSEVRAVTLDVPGLGLHHDLQPTPHGTFLSLDRRSVGVVEFPTSETDPDAPWAPATLRDDSIVEFLPDGTLRREWPLVDLLDLERIGYDSLRNFAQGLDWTHSNAVTYNLEDDSIVVSVRHQDAVIKFSRETGELQWILGPHDNWSSEFQQFLLFPMGSSFRWQFHQHSPKWTPSGSLVLFDNGNHRASPFDGNTPMPADQSFSRGVEYEIDPQSMTVQQVWEYGETSTEQLYSFFISDADALEATGNRLITFGGVNYVDGVASADLGLGPNHARIIETTGGPNPVEVFSMTIYDPDGGQIQVYRSERLGSLYPATYVTAPNGAGTSVRMQKTPELVELSWTASAVDAAHDAADYYMVYASDSPAGGFSMLDSTAFTETEVGDSGSSLTCYKVVAANTAGTSGDEP